MIDFCKNVKCLIHMITYTLYSPQGYNGVFSRYEWGFFGIEWGSFLLLVWIWWIEFGRDCKKAGVWITPESKKALAGLFKCKRVKQEDETIILKPNNSSEFSSSEDITKNYGRRLSGMSQAAFERTSIASDCMA